MTEQINRQYSVIPAVECLISNKTPKDEGNVYTVPDQGEQRSPGIGPAAEIFSAGLNLTPRDPSLFSRLRSNSLFTLFRGVARQAI